MEKRQRVVEHPMHHGMGRHLKLWHQSAIFPLKMIWATQWQWQKNVTFQYASSSWMKSRSVRTLKKRRSPWFQKNGAPSHILPLHSAVRCFRSVSSTAKLKWNRYLIRRAWPSPIYSSLGFSNTSSSRATTPRTIALLMQAITQKSLTITLEGWASVLTTLHTAFNAAFNWTADIWNM